MRGGRRFRLFRRAQTEVFEDLLDGDLVVQVGNDLLKACATPRAVEGLLHGLGDSQLSVRYECGAALSRLVERDVGLAPAQRRIFDAVKAELAAWAEAESARDRERRIEHVFNLLASVLDRRPLRIAHQALRTDDALRGTALEYLDNVLPPEITARLFPLLGAPAARRGPRGAAELRDVLVREGDSVALRRAFLKRRLHRGD